MINITKCRSCGSTEIVDVHDFGIVPFADKLTSSVDSIVISENLSIIFCHACLHLQIKENVDPNILFKDHYPYFSSKIPEVAIHFEHTYREIISHIELNPEDRVLEIASNDGVLLKHFLKHTPNLIAVEPSEDHTSITNELGITSYSEFFNMGFAKTLGPEFYHGVRLIMANNVLAHVPVPYEIVLGIAHLLADDGLAVIEVPHSLNIIKNCTFDVIFHQHFSYFNLHSLVRLFEGVDLTINSVQKIDTQGGSYRLFISRSQRIGESIASIIEEETAAGLKEISTYIDFSNRIRSLKNRLNNILVELLQKGSSIIGYGAPGKAATLLNYFGIDSTILEYLVDISESKHYKYFPNTGLRIFPVEYVTKDKPDYILILAWNYADSIMRSLVHLKEKGVKFILIYPEVRII